MYIEDWPISTQCNCCQEMCGIYPKLSSYLKHNWWWLRDNELHDVQKWADF